MFKVRFFTFGAKICDSALTAEPRCEAVGSWVVQSWKVLGTGAAAHAEEARCQSGCN